MRYLQKLLNINRPHKDRLLDFALILAILPHIFLFKSPMIIFLIISAILLVKNKTTDKYQYFITTFGLFAIILSFFDNYNFENLSKMIFFVSLVSNLLVYAVVLQKFKGEYNAYIKMSPALLMLLIFFYYSSITMLIYAIFVLFSFVLMTVWANMDTNLSAVIKVTTRLFVLALPIVVILFIIFPRISFQKTDFGFKGDYIATTGHDGTMYLGSEALLVPSEKVVMEVEFTNKIPQNNQLYFRGSVLYKDSISAWKQIDTKNLKISKRKFEKDSLIDYKVLLYPSYQRWIYLLDLPTITPLKSKMNYDLIALSTKPIDEIIRYKAISALNYKYIGKLKYPSEALEVDRDRNPRTIKIMDKIKNLNITDKQKAQKILEFFQTQKLSYSLKPKPIDLNNSTDSFLFDSKVGYCVHFASSFAISSRLVGIPSRIVTGFKASKSNMVENYLIVRELDAHAWVELFLDDIGWQRFEPTNTAYQILSTVDNIGDLNIDSNSIFKTINLNFMYIKYLINNWILEYNRSKQKALLKEILENGIFMAKILIAIALLILSSIALYILLQRKKCTDIALCTIAPLIKKLKKKGLVRKPYESIEEFLKRSNNIIKTKKISNLYHTIKYSQKIDKRVIKKLENEVKIKK